MSAIDKELVRRKLEELRECLRKLAEFRGMDKTIFVSDYHQYGLAEHFLQLAIELILDVCRHMVIALQLRAPDDAHGLFPLLEQNRILSADFVQKNIHMPGFRNRLVHGYADIDHEKAYEYLQMHLDDFEDFIQQISKYLL